MPRIKELAHTVIYVSDLTTSRDWYCKHLGMTVVVDSPERKGSFLSFGESDHDIALFENPVATGFSNSAMSWSLSPKERKLPLRSGLSTTTVMPRCLQYQSREVVRSLT